MDPEWQLAARNLWQTRAPPAVSGYRAAPAASRPEPAALAQSTARAEANTVSRSSASEIGPVMTAPWTAPGLPRLSQHHGERLLSRHRGKETAQERLG